jgi:hypothetical protein
VSVGAHGRAPLPVFDGRARHLIRMMIGVLVTDAPFMLVTVSLALNYTKLVKALTSASPHPTPTTGAAPTDNERSPPAPDPFQTAKSPPSNPCARFLDRLY